MAAVATICSKYQTNKVASIEQKHAEAIKRISARVHIHDSESVLTASHIEEMFKIIDDVFFSKQLDKILKSRGIELKFDTNLRLTSTGGYFKKVTNKNMC